MKFEDFQGMSVCIPFFLWSAGLSPAPWGGHGSRNMSVCLRCPDRPLTQAGSPAGHDLPAQSALKSLGAELWPYLETEPRGLGLSTPCEPLGQPGGPWSA